jgi:hypothetical protein
VIDFAILSLFLQLWNDRNGVIRNGNQNLQKTIAVLSTGTGILFYHSGSSLNGTGISNVKFVSGQTGTGN